MVLFMKIWENIGFQNFYKKILTKVFHSNPKLSHPD